MRPLAIALLLGALAGCGPGGDKGATVPAGDKATAESAAKSAGKAAAKPSRLPLERGYFVRMDLACDQATSDSLFMHRGNGIATDLQFCAFETVKALEDNSYEVVQVCEDAVSGSKAAPMTAVYKVNGPMAYEAKDEEGWEYGAKFCSQAELPEPWRSKDISALLK